MFLPKKVKSMAQPWAKIFTLLIGLYGVAILTSMAAMEITAWLTVTAVLINLILTAKNVGFRETLSAVKIGPDRFLWAFFLIVAVGLYFTPVTDAVMKPWPVLGSMRWIVVLYAITWALLWVPREKIEKLMSGFFVLLFIISLYSIAQFLWGVDFFHSKQTVWLASGGGVYRAPGLFNSSLTFAYVIGGFGLIGAGRLWALPLKEWPKHWPWILGFVGALIGCLTSLTRGSWIAAFLAAAIVLLFVKPRRLVALVVVAALVVGAGMLASGGMRDRITSLFDSKYTSNLHRTIIWRANWEIVKDHPIRGSGYGLNSFLANDYYDRYMRWTPEQSEEAFKALKIPRRDIATHAHNNLLHTLVGTGIFGLICFIAFCAYFLRQAWRVYADAVKRKDNLVASLALGLFGAQLFFHIGGLTECNFTDSEVTHMLLLNWALVGALQKVPGPVSGNT